MHQPLHGIARHQSDIAPSEHKGQERRHNQIGDHGQDADNDGRARVFLGIKTKDQREIDGRKGQPDQVHAQSSERLCCVRSGKGAMLKDQFDHRPAQ